MILRNNWLKAGIRRLFLPPGTGRRIRFRPRRGGAVDVGASWGIHGLHLSRLEGRER